LHDLHYEKQTQNMLKNIFVVAIQFATKRFNPYVLSLNSMSLI